MDINTFIENGQQDYLPNLSVDMVIIGFHEDQLKCLLLQIGDKWLLPGGYILRSESVEAATVRILRERTGLEDPHFKFLSVFGGEDRKFTEEWQQFFKELDFPFKENSWTRLLVGST
jgi:ADP-ribose pyrophosphatase YjhB (NUDIX family)